MKKLFTGVIMLCILILLIGCDTKDDSTIKNGTYVMDQEGVEKVLLPRIMISEKDIVFIHDLLSSYLPYGTYSINEDILTMTTDDDQYTYIFQIDGDSLIFQKNESSAIKRVNDAFGTLVADQSKFVLTEEQ